MILLSISQPNHANERNGENALHTSIRVGNREIVNLLCKYNVDPTASNHREETPMGLALQEGDFEIIHTLVTKVKKASVQNGTFHPPRMSRAQSLPQFDDIPRMKSLPSNNEEY